MTAYPDAKMLIGGDWRMSDPQPVENPFDESEVGVRAHAKQSDLDEAVAAAKQGLKAWGDLGPLRRQQIMSKAADLLRERADQIALSITLEQGKTVGEARMEVLRAAANIEWDGHEGRRIYGRVIPSGPDHHIAAYRQPIGIVAGFAPWNFPIASPSRKIGAPLAAGCSVVLKAAEDTPAGAFELVRALVDAGIPDGVVNLVYGDPPAISDYLITHPDVRMVTFTGSVPVGKVLTALAGAHMKPALMELGGHAPVFISKSADLQVAATSLMMMKSVNAGQVCVSPTRFFVENEVYDEFAALFSDRARALVVGNGTDQASTMGPVINARRIAAVEELMSDAKSAGARVLTGGERLGKSGYCYGMTVLGDVPDDSRIMNEEPFGPVALLNRVTGVEEAIDKANAVPFGLAGYAFTQSARDIHALTTHLEVGNLAINHLAISEPETPFGGIKDSGMGREGGIDGPLGHTITKTVSVFHG